MEFFALAILGIAVGGCSPEGEGVFCNPLQSVVTVTISSSRQPAHSASATIPPGEVCVLMGLRGVDLVTISVDEPRTNFTRSLHVDDPDQRYSGEHEVHFL